MLVRCLALLLIFSSAPAARAAGSCQDLVRLKDLPADYKVVSRSALGPAELLIRSNGRCTCNDLPAVQRSLGQAEPAEVNWACDAAEAADTKSK